MIKKIIYFVFLAQLSIFSIVYFADAEKKDNDIPLKEKIMTINDINAVYRLSELGWDGVSYSFSILDENNLIVDNYLHPSGIVSLEGDDYKMRNLFVYIDSNVDDTYLNCIVSDTGFIRDSVICSLYLKSFDKILY
jgi:hypothetical protein